MTDYLVVCAWCDKVMRVVGRPPAADPPVSHGMCEECSKRDEQQYERSESDDDSDAGDLRHC